MSNLSYLTKRQPLRSGYAAIETLTMWSLVMPVRVWKLTRFGGGLLYHFLITMWNP